MKEEMHAIPNKKTTKSKAFLLQNVKKELQNVKKSLLIATKMQKTY